MNWPDFKALHVGALEQNEAKHTVLLSAIERGASEDPPGQTRKWSLGQGGACAVRSPRRGVALGDVNQEQAHDLAGQLAGAQFTGVLGNDETALWFVERAAELGVAFHDPMPQRIHVLTDAPQYPGANGRARPITSDDAELFADWFVKFCAEASPEDDIPSRAEMDRRAASGHYLLWDVNGEAVSMAGSVRQTRSCAAIAAVYTPHELRGRGYAGSVTAAVVEKVFAEGKTTACLYTDLRNPASNCCYAKIGFRPLCESWFFLQRKES